MKCSFLEDEGTAEWSTEGVQIGDVKSAMGVLGLWTGAQHDPMDPIGESSYCIYTRKQ
jgi:hypothetical protein